MTARENAGTQRSREEAIHKELIDERDIEVKDSSSKRDEREVERARS